MEKIFSEEAYEEMIAKLFVRFPSFQKAGVSAYKPGLGNMEFFDQLAGRPHASYRVVHVAGTNGKGSVSNMLASILASQGLRVGLYTSPHIVDFRERVRTIESEGTYSLVSKEYVWGFVNKWQETFDHLDMSFFEITTSLAFSWFADQKVDVVVLETGLGGRLDSTNIVRPALSVITNIGLDHCDMLGETLPEVAFEKAGIIKPKVPVVIGESHPETDPVFERKVLYTNLPEPAFMGSRTEIMSLLTFADKAEPRLWDRHEDVLHGMDLKGEYQRKNLRTVLAALDVIASGDLLHSPVLACPDQADAALAAIMHTSARTGFRGRWETLSDDPRVICDIGHNEHGLRNNFSQLERMLSEGGCSHLIVVYGSVADKDVDPVLRLLPENASYIFTQARSKRSLPATEIRDRYLAFCASCGRSAGDVLCVASVAEAVKAALDIASSLKAVDPDSSPLVYIGGSTYVVSEAVAMF